MKDWGKKLTGPFPCIRRVLQGGAFGKPVMSQPSLAFFYVPDVIIFSYFADFNGGLSFVQIHLHPSL
jgi:hypothetical protein